MFRASSVFSLGDILKMNAKPFDRAESVSLTGGASNACSWPTEVPILELVVVKKGLEESRICGGVVVASLKRRSKTGVVADRYDTEILYENNVRNWSCIDTPCSLD